MDNMENQGLSLLRLSPTIKEAVICRWCIKWSSRIKLSIQLMILNLSTEFLKLNLSIQLLKLNMKIMQQC